MALEPITRAEQIMSGESLEPITREEMFLAKAAGMDVDTPKPITRREMFLSKISGGSGGGSGVDYEAMLAGVIDGTATNLEIPAGTASIRERICYNCDKLTNVSIPGSVTEIISMSPTTGQFGHCDALQTVVIENGVQLLKGAVFYQCKSLKTVKILGKLEITTAAGTYPFQLCDALTDLYVAWAEGEVAGAPWGATNATIHYNYTGG